MNKKENFDLLSQGDALGELKYKEVIEDLKVFDKSKESFKLKPKDIYLIKSKNITYDDKGVPEVHAQIVSCPKGEELVLPDGYIIEKKLA